MGRERFYKPGSFYRICDKTGFATRAERTEREWQGLIVDRRVYEARHPQDFVKGVYDNQTVPFPRPRQPDVDVNASESAQFEVFGDIPAQQSFFAQSGQIWVARATPAVTAASFPKSF